MRTDVDRHEIQGGERIPSGSFQNVVYVNMDSGFCTGTLVHWNWILTAGHCVSINNGAQINPVNRVTFGRGESYRVDLFNIGRILIHPQYNSRGIPGFSYDYALVEILDGAPPGIEPVPLMSFDQERDFFTRSEREGIIIGHGYIREALWTSTLTMGRFQFKPRRNAPNSKGLIPESFIRRRFVPTRITNL